jgi:hypothetical protein
MPAAIAAAIIYALRVYAFGLIGKILLSMGLAVYTLNFAWPDLKTWVGQQLHMLPDFIKDSVAASGFDIMLTMILSALVIRATSRVVLGRMSPV